MERALGSDENLWPVLHGISGLVLDDGKVHHPDKWHFDCCLSGRSPILLHAEKEEWSVSGSLKENRPNRFALRGHLNTGERYRLVVEKSDQRVFAYLFRCPPFHSYGPPHLYYVCYA